MQAAEEPVIAAGPELVHGLRQYLLGAGPAILQLQDQEHVLAHALEEPEHTAHLEKFLADASVSTLYVV